MNIGLSFVPYLLTQLSKHSHFVMSSSLSQTGHLKNFPQSSPQSSCSQEWGEWMNVQTDWQPRNMMPPAVASAKAEKLNPSGPVILAVAMCFLILLTFLFLNN